MYIHMKADAYWPSGPYGHRKL